VTNEEQMLRRRCGEGKRGVWIPPGLSIETLKATVVLAEWLDRNEKPCLSQGSSINERGFVGVYRQPSGPSKYHADRRHVQDLKRQRQRSER
jgi:hypothetical protein